MDSIFSAVTPVLITFVVVYGVVKKIPVYQAFAEGAKEGIKLAFSILPYVLAFSFAVKMFEASGGFETLTSALLPALTALRIPFETLPMIIIRPFSGSGALAALQNIFTSVGVDSQVSRVACVMCGSSETLFYTMSVYLSANGITKSRYIIPAALFSQLVGIFGAILICRWL